MESMHALGDISHSILEIITKRFENFVKCEQTTQNQPPTPDKYLHAVQSSWFYEPVVPHVDNREELFKGDDMGGIFQSRRL